MKTFLISYDLDKPGQNYQKLIAELERLGGFRVLFSQWAVQLSNPVVQVRDHLLQFIDSNDRLLVMEVGNWASWGLMSGDKFKQIAA